MLFQAMRTHLCIDKVCKVLQPLLVSCGLKGGSNFTNQHWEPGAPARTIWAVALSLQVAKGCPALIPQGGAKEGGHCDAGGIHMGGQDNLQNSGAIAERHW